MTRNAFLITVASLAVALGSAGACASDTPESAAPSEDAPPLVSVTITPIVQTTLHGYVDGWGKVEPEPAGEGRPPASATIATPVAGLVSDIECQEGQRVKQGTMLFHLDPRVADVAVERARQAVDFAQSVVTRQEQLGPGEATSQRAYQDAKQQLVAAQSELAAAEVQRGLLDVTAPIDGTIMRVRAQLGDAVDPSTALADLIDLSRLVVNASIRSVDIQHVAVGQLAQLSGGDISTPISFIAAQVDSATDTVLVRAPVPPRSGLRPGQFVNVRIAAEERVDRLAVPVESLLEGPDGPEVALVQGDTATRTRVTPGLRDAGLVEISGEGLRAGMSVVVQGAYGLPPTSRITIVGR